MEETELERYEEFEEVEEADLFHDETKLMRIAGWANITSWIILVIAAAFSLIGVFVQVSQGILKAGVSGILSLLTTLFILLVGGFLFVVLQAIGEGIYLFMDVEEHLRKD